MFDQNVEDATRWLAQLPAGDPRERGESRLVSLWASKDPGSAANWVSTLPLTEQSNVAGIIANYWMDTNWPDASRWIATLTGDARDAALAAAVNRDGSTKYDSLSLALSIQQEQLRNNAVDQLIRSWAATDANAAETWVNGSSLSSEQQDHLRSVISDTRESAADVERVIVQ
jgi:hypothetical protein